jgi:hypothetical protein
LICIYRFGRKRIYQYYTFPDVLTVDEDFSLIPLAELGLFAVFAEPGLLLLTEMVEIWDPVKLRPRSSDLCSFLPDILPKK